MNRQRGEPTMDMDIKTVAVADIVFRDDLYPRIKTSPETVQKYTQNLEVLPPIEVNEANELIDGWHRWTAHKKIEIETIQVVVTETGINAAKELKKTAIDEVTEKRAAAAIKTAETRLLELAIERNASHGLQMSQVDKRAMAQRIYKETKIEEQPAKKEKLAANLSVPLRTIQDWLATIDRDNIERRNCKIRDMYLALYSANYIAEKLKMHHSSIQEVLRTGAILRLPAKPGDYEDIKDETERLNKIEDVNKALAEHQAEFEPPLYNVWRRNSKSSALDHFGNTEMLWLDNLLYLYTKSFDVVIDPFAGSGTTLDVCRKRFRRCWVSDRLPIIERENEIRQHDITDNKNAILPPLSRWKDIALVYLDPPYWRQAVGRYSNDPTDLANMELEQFNKVLSGLINEFGKKLKDNERAHIALVIQPTQWNAPDREVADHVVDMVKAVKLPLVSRISAPYTTEQYNAQQVDWAKENRKCLVLTREIIVWRASV